MFCPEGQTFTFPKLCWVNVALMFRGAVTVKVQVGLVPEQGALQPAKAVPTAGTAVKVTCELTG